MRRQALTKKQGDVLKSIIAFQKIHGYPPTVRELCGLTGVRSTSTIAMHMNHLKEQGYITWISSMPRTIQILKEA
jgi:repressor LexA